MLVDANPFWFNNKWTPVEWGPPEPYWATAAALGSGAVRRGSAQLGGGGGRGIDEWGGDIYWEEEEQEE